MDPKTSPTQPQQPAQPPSVPSGPVPATPAPSKNKAKGIMIGILVAFLLLGGGAAAYLQLTHNSPAKIWERAMNATGEGLDRFIELSNNQSSPGMKVDGNFALTAPVVIDGSMSGQWHGSNGSMTMDIGAGGVRVDGELRTVATENSTNPDMYFRVDGLSAINALLSGLGETDDSISTLLSQLDGQWIGVDHTFLDQYTSLVLNPLPGSGLTFSDEDSRELMDTLSGVLKEYVFTADSEKAVFQVVNEVGKEDFEGTPSYKFEVGVDKEGLKGFFTALKEALRGTVVEGMLTTGGMSYDEAFDLENALREIDNEDFSSAKTDVWVEESGRFVRNVRFYMDQDNKGRGHIDIGIPYTEGDVVPAVIKIVSNDEASGDVGEVSFGLDVNSTNGDGRVWMNMDIGAGLNAVKANAEISLASSGEEVQVEVPQDAINVFELLSELAPGLEDLGTDSSTQSVPVLDDFFPSTPDLEI